MESSDDLVWLIYTSFATEDLDDIDLTALLERSRLRNAERGVTGLLLFRDQRFLQALEGPRGVVEPLMARIADDLRHLDVYVLLEEPIAERRFPSWSMGYQGWRDADVEWPGGSVATFDRVTSASPSDENMQAIHELFEWFRAVPEAAHATPVGAGGR